MPQTMSAQLIAMLRRASVPFLTLLYAGGWPATLAQILGIQQSVRFVIHDVAIQRTPKRHIPLRLVFATDFHAGATTHPQVLAAACDAIRMAQPDLLLLGGDFVSLHASQIDDLANSLGGIKAPLGRFAVLGNHDRWVDTDYIIRQLTRANIQVLVNRNVRLPEPYTDVWICGLDDVDTGKPDPSGAFQDADGVRIVLMHSPDGLRDIQHIGFDLVLCGHTHGGQLALPNGRPLLLPGGPFCRAFPHGRFQINTTRTSTLIVSRGVGYITVPLRLFADPDIVVCNIVI